MRDYLKLAEHKNCSTDYERAKQLRKQAPLAEKLLWNILRSFPNENIKFRRQHALTPYIVDFICLKAKLVIELDGHSHNSRQEQDSKRDNYLNGLGFKVLRFSNDDVMRNVEGVALTIINRAKELLVSSYTPLPQPLPQGEGSTSSSCGKEKHSP